MQSIDTTLIFNRRPDKITNGILIITGKSDLSKPEIGWETVEKLQNSDFETSNYLILY